VREVRFLSTRRRTLSASPVGGPPVVVGPPTVVGPCLWSRMMPSPGEVCQSNRSHICT
jgi:hypothetical protein